VNASYGSIHGRFQPFHNGHLAYAMAALSQVETLYVGLTRVLTEPGIGADVAPHRLEAKANPLTYFQRSQLVSAALLGAGVPPGRFSVGPFPIEVPGRLVEFWPLSLGCFTTIVDDWNREKINVLRDCGYTVNVLEDVVQAPSRVASGTKVRELIREGGSGWEAFVPAATVPLIKQYRASF
jgi:cytidyltransferase-like protein